MWDELPLSQKNEYKRLILAFASLTDMFAQKASKDNMTATPIINSKYQETAFQRAFHAYAEDIGNTSYDASVQHNEKKYLVGIKTFGIGSGDQKIAQFKAMHDEWAQIIDEIKKNAADIEDKNEIDRLNLGLYEELAKKIAQIRNERIESAYANIRGFKIEVNDSHVHSVYHVLMPSRKDETPKIYVGETSYDKINIDQIQVLGCTGWKNPTNFSFTDGNHTYKYTSADSQLYMHFNNQEIVCEEWKVKYADDAYAIFSKIADMVFPELNPPLPASTIVTTPGSYAISPKTEQFRIPVETYCWTIWNKDGETELFSGFNSFYGIGSKMGMDQRVKRIRKIYDTFEDTVEKSILCEIRDGLNSFLLEPASSADKKNQKVRLREYLLKLSQSVKNSDFEDEISKILFRPVDEMYIPIPDSAQFHKNHPNFFGNRFGECIPGTTKLKLPKELRRFNLVFDPSGDNLPAYITQDNGKAIESAEKQSYLGEWILRGIFQLEKYEPLTSSKLTELNINGLRFSRYEDSDDIHIEFIWIDESHPPKGFIPRL